MRKAILYIGLTILAVLAVFLVWKYGASDKQTNNDSTSIDTQIENWKAYENTVYQYKFSYPNNALIANTQEMNPYPVSQSNDIQVFIPGKITFVSIFAFSKGQSTASISVPGEFVIDNLSIEELAKKIHQNQIDDKNPNMRDKRVGELREVNFAGEKAYSFTLTKGFSTGSVNGIYMGYTLSDTHNYIFTEKNGIKFVIHYPLEDKTTKEIMGSFKFNDVQ